MIVLAAALAAVAGLLALARGRQAACAYVPLLAEELLPNADLAAADGSGMPAGWGRGVPAGVELQGNRRGFDYDGNGRALQLIGIANYVQSPPLGVRPGASYCFAGRALTDSDKRSATKLRLAFDWRDAADHALREDTTAWQPVVLWRADAPPADWSAIRGAFVAPAGAATLRVRLEPASDDRVYLDAMHVRRTTDAGRQAIGQAATSPAASRPSPVAIQPWPNGARAATSFSFDWETAMGGLIHSRSIDDPNADQDWQVRAMRMREGVTTTLDLFRPYGIRATYYANGYNFLLGNAGRRQFMGNPTFSWADHTTSGKWPNDAWATTPWFADDPYGTAQSDPGWYFGDLIPALQRERQDIQSHTFSHLDGGLARPQEWRDDLRAWREVAAERGVPPATSLAFPWSSSAGMSYASWDELAAAGITSVTRTKPNQPQYQLASEADPRCRPVPGHERILACPDFYLHSQETAAQAIALIDRTIEVGGMIDLWAHTEEVTSPDQIAAWGQVVAYAARQRDAGKLWVAPLAEIAGWQAALAGVSIQESGVASREPGAPLALTVTNKSDRDLSGLTLSLSSAAAKIVVNGTMLNPQSPRINLAAGQTLEVQVWPA
ncbi:MAG: polysaccharide deacetylase [Kouleothrix sp.]|nr:polysaccharide deacetylase [Kouleothrix sp.]